MRTRDEIKILLEKVLAEVGELEAQAQFFYSSNIATRFGENSITQNMAGEQENIRLLVYNGRRSGSTITNKMDDDSLAKLAKIAISMAQDSPEDPEYVELPGPQNYPITPKSFYDDVVELTPERIAKDVNIVIAAAKEKGFMASGLFEATVSAEAIANSKGLFGYQDGTVVEYSTTVNGPTGGGKALVNENSYKKIDAHALAKTALDNALAAQNPADIEPGDYTVIMEPLAVLEMLAFLAWNMSARDADEGTTVFAGKVGEKMFDDRVNFRLVLDDEKLPGPTFGDAGLAMRPINWVENGVLKRLRHNRFWAKTKRTEPDPGAWPLFIDGEDRSLGDLVKMCKRGLLIKNLWYIRYVDRKELLLTGMTRDGMFLVEDGKIVGPVKNLRWNESPVVFLKNIVALSRPERVSSYAKLPGIMSDGFTMSSKTESI